MAKTKLNISDTQAKIVYSWENVDFGASIRFEVPSEDISSRYIASDVFYYAAVLQKEIEKLNTPKPAEEEEK